MPLLMIYVSINSGCRGATCAKALQEVDMPPLSDSTGVVTTSRPVEPMAKSSYGILKQWA